MAQIAKDKAFTALNKASDAYGHYLVNDDRRIWVKYRETSEPPWVFTYRGDEVLRIAVDEEDYPNHRVVVVLVCGDQTPCALTTDELWQVLDRDDLASQQAVSVDVPRGGSMWVSGPAGDLGRPVRHNSFPGKVLG